MKKPVSDDQTFNLQERIIAASRERYATHRDDIPPPPPSAERARQPMPVPPKPKPESHVQPLQPLTSSQQDKTIEALAERAEQKQHRYWQNMIKKIAEERGYKAEIELSVLHGKGQVDVSLERDGTRIAVEISVSTKPAWELHNIKKCLEAGYDMIIACCTNKQTLQQLRKQVLEECSPSEQQKITITDPDRISEILPQPNQPPESQERRIKGYRVHVTYGNITASDQTHKQQSLARIIGEAKNKK